MSERSNLMLAALASAAMPRMTVAGVRDDEGLSATDAAHHVHKAVIQDTAGRLYDVYASHHEDGQQRLEGRVRAAATLAKAKEPAALGFGIDRVIRFLHGDEASKLTNGATVLITEHLEGEPRMLKDISLDDCASVGTAIGAIHRLNAQFLPRAGYPAYNTQQIRQQLTAWITRLRNAGHVPREITASWARIMATDGLWSFATRAVHGGFHDGDMLFSSSTVSAVTNWQDMQMNDPARDIAWTFSELDGERRNAVLAAYGRMLGSQLDDLIMLRANLWLQMEQVGDFIQALDRADTMKILQFKAQVEQLAHDLSVSTQTGSWRAGSARAQGADGSNGNSPQASAEGMDDVTNDASAQARSGRAADANATAAASTLAAALNNPTTITVGNLLNHHEAQSHNQPHEQPREPFGEQLDNSGDDAPTVGFDTASVAAKAPSRVNQGTMPQREETRKAAERDATGESAMLNHDDSTSSSRFAQINQQQASSQRLAAPLRDTPASAADAITHGTAETELLSAAVASAERKAAAKVTGTMEAAEAEIAEAASSSDESIAAVDIDVEQVNVIAAVDKQTAQARQNRTEPAPATMVIPLLEREAKALRDARESLAARTGSMRLPRTHTDVTNAPDAHNATDDASSEASSDANSN